MGFDEEWAQLRSEAAARQTSGMRLNKLAPVGGGGGGGEADFGSDPKKKATAAGKLDGEVKTQTVKASDHADEATTGAVSEFSGWDTAAGLKTVQKTWETQVNTLTGRLSTEAANLRTTRSMFLGKDFELYHDFAPLRKQSGLDAQGRGGQ
ncbi:hypothetical protein [Streptomyces fradiae]|uniref:hypothetical protein n=1 Tax=Streptomyces fradiae TaxID=1906 RepID=UPI0039879580